MAADSMNIKNLSHDYSKRALVYIQRLSDVRFLGQVIFVVIVLLISWSGIKTIETNYGLQKQISSIDQQNQLQKLQNDNLALQNQYLNSNQYLELAARQNFGLAAPGEKEIVVPEKVALAYSVPIPAGPTPDTAAAHQPAYQRNFQSWVDFFLHRQNGGH
jgi:cell division protein FtsB